MSEKDVMVRRCCRIRVDLLGLGSIALLAIPAFADSLLLKDGRLISGQVSHTDSGYVVHTRSGEQAFSDDDVEHWTHSESADPSDNPAAPSTSSGPGPAAPTPASPGKPAAVTGAAPGGAGKTSQQKSVAKLVERGNTALAGGDYKAARDAFADAMLLDTRNAAAAQGLGYAYLQLSPPNYTKARDALETAYAGLQPPPRSLACDLALALAQTHNQMRAAKVLKEYLITHPAPLDEPALNAMAAALFQADDQVRRNSFYAQVAQFYDDYNAKLEATRPGEKRWGTSWLPSVQADRKLKTYLDKRAKIEGLTRQMANDQEAYNSAAEDAVTEARSSHPGAGARVAALNNQMKAAQTDFTKAQAELAKAQEGFELPPIDATLAVVEPEAATALASAAPVSAEPTPAGGTDLSAVKPAFPDPALPGKLFGSDPVTPPAPPAPGQPAPAGAPAVIAARPAEPAPKRRLCIESNAVAFPVGPDLVVTTADAVSNASNITVQIPAGDTMNAKVVSKDDASGLALLRVPGKRLVYLPLADAFTAGPITCISFPEVNLFDPAAAAIAGNIAALQGTPGKFTVSLSRSPRLGGGPLLVNGKVVGVQLANRDSDQHAITIATLDDLKRLLATTGQPGTPTPGFDPKAITMQLTAIKGNR
jgi:hypothetical protein